MTVQGRHVVVVDGSNLATEGRTTPSLRQLDEAVRAYAIEDPDAEIVVVVDASFEHRIDPSERDQLVDAELHGEVVSPPAGAIGRGDAFVLRIAERTGARVLSNDSFQEFHAEHSWLFEEGRLIGGKPVPGVGWIFTPRIPVRGPKSRQVTGKAKRRATEELSPTAKAAELAKAAKKVAARKAPATVFPDGSKPKIGDVWKVEAPSAAGLAETATQAATKKVAKAAQAAKAAKAVPASAGPRAASKKSAAKHEERQQEQEVVAEAPAEKAAEKVAPAKKATQKAAPAKAKKAAPAEKAAEKVAEKAAPAKKATQKAAPAEKVAEKVAPAKKAADKAAPAKKAAAAKRAAPAKKATGKKRPAPEEELASAGSEMTAAAPAGSANGATAVAKAARSTAAHDPAVQEAIGRALVEVIAPPSQGGDGGSSEHAEEKVGKREGKANRRRRRRAPSPPPAVNEPLAFITFVATYPLGSEVEGEVVSYTSHGAMVDVDLPEGGVLHAYIPLTAMGSPPPTKAREIVKRGDRRRFVLVALDPPRRVAELALPELVSARPASRG